MTDQDKAGCLEFFQIMAWFMAALVGLSVLGVCFTQAVQNG